MHTYAAKDMPIYMFIYIYMIYIYMIYIYDIYIYIIYYRTLVTNTDIDIHTV